MVEKKPQGQTDSTETHSEMAGPEKGRIIFLPDSAAISTSSSPVSRVRDPFLGRTLGGRFLINRELGRGGIGLIYLASDLRLCDRPVVVKVLNQIVETGDDYQWYEKKFRVEIEALARLNHPGIVSVLDQGVLPDGKPYIVMEYVRGQSLRAVMNQTRHLAFSRIAHVIQQIGQALAYAHEQGVYHRDLKPDNILLQSYGGTMEMVKLIDFGIATVTRSPAIAEKEITRIAGTLPYMAPEQLKGQPSAASDIYALGVIAYEMVTGQQPFQSSSAVHHYEMQREGPQILPRAIRQALPESAQEAILKCLAFISTSRFAQASEFSETLAWQLLADVEGGASAMRRRQKTQPVGTRALITTVGEVTHKLIQTIVEQRPETVYFLCSRATSARIAEIRERVAERGGQEAVTWRDQRILVEDASDLIQCYTYAQAALRELKSLGLKPEEIKVDYTSGTKTMSVALALAAAEQGFPNPW